MGNTGTGQWDMVEYQCLSWEPRRKKTQIETTHLKGDVVLGIHTYNLCQNPVPEES